MENDKFKILLDYIDNKPKPREIGQECGSSAKGPYSITYQALNRDADTIRLDLDGYTMFRNNVMVYSQKWLTMTWTHFPSYIQQFRREFRYISDFRRVSRKCLLLVLEKDSVMGDHLYIAKQTDTVIILRFKHLTYDYNHALTPLRYKVRFAVRYSVYRVRMLFMMGLLNVVEFILQLVGKTLRNDPNKG